MHRICGASSGSAAKPDNQGSSASRAATAGRNDMTELRPAACPPSRRLGGVTREEFVKMIQWHERKADEAMGSLHCG